MGDIVSIPTTGPQEAAQNATLGVLANTSGVNTGDQDLSNIEAILHTGFLRLGQLNSLMVGSVPNGMFDVFQDTSGIDAGLSSLYLTATNKVTPNNATIGDNIEGDTNYSAAYTLINCSEALPAGVTIKSCDIFTLSATGSGIIKLFTVNGSNYNVLDLQSFTKTGTGSQNVVLSTPYLVPASGTHYIGIYGDATLLVAGNNHYGKAGYTNARQFQSGNIGPGTNLGGWSAKDGVHGQIKTHYESNMTLVSTAVTMPVQWSQAILSVLIENYDASLKAYVSTASSPAWTELTGLALAASNIGGSGINQYASSLLGITGSSDKSVRVKIAVNGIGVSPLPEIHGYCVTGGGQGLAVAVVGTGNLLGGVGAGALLPTGSGQDNVLLGDGAGEAMTDAPSCVAVGVRALAANVLYDGKVAVGKECLYRDVANSQNTGVGYQAGFWSTTGKNLGFFGSGAGYWNTVADNNVTVCGMGNSGLDNDGDGLAGNLIGGYNASCGWDSLNYLTSGNHNWAGGTSSGFSLRSGSKNTYSGVGSGYHNVSADGQVALGYEAGFWEDQPNTLFIDNAPRASKTDARAKSLVYGKFDAAIANQFFQINGKFGCNGVTPPAQSAHIADATGAADVITRCNAILVVLENHGFMAAA